MTTKNEIYEDVLEEEPDINNKKEYAKWEKRLNNSIARIDFDTERFRAVDEKGKSWLGAEVREELVYNVSMEDGGLYTCDKQIDATLLSLVIQINTRLKRLEKLLNR